MTEFEVPPMGSTWVFGGDSITHGVYHTHGARSWVELVHEHVRWELDRLDDVVINSGVSGWTAPQLVADWHRLVGRYEPQVVGYAFGTNDALGMEAGLDGFTRAMTELVQRALAAGAQVVLQTPTLVTRGTPARFEHLPHYAAAIRSIAEREGAVLVDHGACWAEHFGELEPIAWLDDHTHPNAAGHRAIADHLLETLGLGPMSERP
jgi:lysophospholipase L1-like esterase